MSGICEGRIVVITGAGGGIGREHALAFAAEGARVVVNDLGGARDGSGASAGPAQAVAEEIKAKGGEAVAHTEDISTWDGSLSLIQTAIDAFGGLDVVVNNAGILRDRMLTNMTEAEWDSVIKVHLKGTFGPAHHAAAYWRDRSKAGETVDARIINTSSPSGIFGNVGQSNYGAAKAGIAAFTVIAAMELGRYGVTVNAIAPTALTRMTEDLGFVQQQESAAKEQLEPVSTWSPLGAENISPLVVWLGSPQSKGVTGRVFSVSGGFISVAEGWVNGPSVDRQGKWEPGELGEVIPDLVAKAAPNATMLGTRPTA
ncbi:SDR family oxidoreductase [Frankia sp. CNm7]|uniref:SDR family oxidoreductase n=1 Tax=Frankia nepalensis TaxID=1836974 RepID=A0A937RG90_9ACTN|nr:SDR family oxidoreductase [Frankia nepalensis]MBL7501153.1 SDR family oxidoreductase [Frankia nepalensis]MBL7513759.1 SDR family oxidoreductase [Frankia nepalensis]MBL7519801.1 SDR family oxidoreductase [Frankia nepalensis]MBL7631641.1 SDR family oxidoreductase [Frankia nepalensis]